MICESVSSDYSTIRGKTAKRRTFANFGQSSVTKTLPYIQVGKNSKNGNEQAEPEPKSSAKIARLRENGKKKGEKMNAWNLSRQSTMNCIPADNLTINSFVTYKSQSYAKYV